MTINEKTNAGWTPRGTLNWRDVGGLPTSDGAVVRSGHLFRSATLQDLTADDVAVLTGRVRVRTVLDLRHRDESRTEGPGLLGDTTVRHYNVPLHGDWDADHRGPLPARADRRVVGYYASLLEQSGSALATAVSLLALSLRAPVIVHCAAGKDRTGVVVALALASVGVPDVAIVRDYARSTPAVPAVLARLSTKPTYAAHPEGLRPEVNRTRPQSMLAFLGLVRERHGSVAGCLDDLGVDTDVVSMLRESLVIPKQAGAARRRPA